VLAHRAFTLLSPLRVAISPEPGATSKFLRFEENADTPVVASDLLPPSLRGVDVAAASASDFDAILVGGAQ